MLDELKSAARRVNGARQLRGLLTDCRRLLSERGEANSVAIARATIDHSTPLEMNSSPATRMGGSTRMNVRMVRPSRSGSAISRSRYRSRILSMKGNL